MIPLNEFLSNNLLNNLILEAGFDTTFNTADEYINYFRQKYKKFDDSDAEFIKFVMTKVWDGSEESVPFRIDKTKTNVKLYRPYKDNEDLIDWLKNHGVPDISGGSIKPGHITFTWGSGSASSNLTGSGKIATDIQETITCMIFNEYFHHQKDISVEDIKSKDWGEYNKYFTEKSYKTWPITWYNQCINIFKSAPKANDLVAVHYDDDNDAVAISLRKVHNKVRTTKGIRKKDAFDPTDIIVYSKSKLGHIVDGFNNCIESEDGDNLIVALKSLITSLYHDNAYVGVSLKKGSSFRPHFMNFEPAIGFENARFTGKINLDPVYGFFGDDQSAIDEFMNMTGVDKQYYKDIVKTYGKKRNKSCIAIVDCDDEKDIKFSIRTNSSAYHNMLVIEPSLYKALAQMGKVPVTKWQNLLSQSNPSISNIAKTNKYDIDDLISKFEVIKTKFSSIQTTSSQLRHLFEVFGDHEKEFNMDNELWAYYVEINILYAILNSKDPSSAIRNMLLWAEKLDDDGLPYLLIMPVGK